MTKNTTKSKEERLWEMFINEYITTAQFREMMARIKNSKNK